MGVGKLGAALHDFELRGLGSSEPVTPGLDYAAARGLDGKLGAELAYGSLPENSRIEDEGLGASVTSARHERTIGDGLRSVVGSTLRRDRGC
jgi:hypothetical protein